jgi:hypothetical protein
MEFAVWYVFALLLIVAGVLYVSLQSESVEFETSAFWIKLKLKVTARKPRSGEDQVAAAPPRPGRPSSPSGAETPNLGSSSWTGSL